MTAQMHDINLLGAHFDLLLGESDVQPLIPPVIADLRVRNIAVESDGALIIDVTSPGEAKPMPPLLLAAVRDVSGDPERPRLAGPLHELTAKAQSNKANAKVLIRVSCPRRHNDVWVLTRQPDLLWF